MLLGTNWKMNKTQAEATVYANRLRAYLAEGEKAASLEFFLIPPLTSLEPTLRALDGTNVKVGVQNIHWEDSGPYTGEISAEQAFDAGARIAEIGHSERRRLFSETDEAVGRKVASALRIGLTPLVCVGEPIEEKQDGTAVEFVRRQVKKALIHVSSTEADRVWIAYEPVWAIGEGSQAASAAHVSEMHHMIRSTLLEMFESGIARRISIMYGGSVDEQNAIDFSKQIDVDGLFVGRAALDPQAFIRLADAIGGHAAGSRHLAGDK